MHSSEVASQAGVNVQTLRYYERRGLLPVPERTKAGYRAYDERAVRTVRFVKRAQTLGFSLVEIDALLDLAGGGPESCESARKLATERIPGLEEKIAQLQAMADSLRQLVDSCEETRDRRLCPLLEAIETVDGRGDEKADERGAHRG